MRYTLARIYPESLDLAVKKWHVEYYYHNPATHKKQRFKVYEDLNRQKGDAKAAYAIELRDAINNALKGGFNPFADEVMAIDVVVKKEAEVKKLEAAKRYENSWTILRAAQFFNEKKAEKGVAKSTLARYATGINYFKNWLNDHELLCTHVKELTGVQVMAYLNETAKKEKWENKTYNNHLTNMHLLFNLLALGIHGIIDKNPIQGAGTRQTLSKKHAAYSDQQLSQILTKVRNNKDTYMEGLIMTSYYACVRSKAEMTGLRAKNVLYDRDLILLSADDTKARREDYIPLDPILKQHYMDKGYDKLPADWYIFGHRGKSGEKAATANAYGTLFREYRKTLKLDSRYTLYGFKHTRNIHLAKAGVSPYALMQLNRWASIDQVMTYLRDLGVIVNQDAVKDSKRI